MNNTVNATIPAASDMKFTNGISHPDLWLWDSWTCRDGDEIHLYCLALPRKSSDGTPITPGDRNNYLFHVRYFRSIDNGGTWKDMGQVLTPGQIPDGTDSRNVWSGSVTRMDDGKFLFSHTGLRQIGDNRPFIQSINATVSTNLTEIQQLSQALLCPLRDYDMITAAGYYLGQLDSVGHADGDENGPITAWRDPYTFIDADGEIHMFFSAKVSATVPAVAHVIVTVEGDNVKLKKLMPPITLPDADIYTQAEVPKLYHDAQQGIYYMLISACDRLHEGQPDSEVSKVQRLYKATAISGPWLVYKDSGSLLAGFENMFGASIIGTDFDSGDFQFVAPITEMEPETELQLTFAPIQTVNIYNS